MKNHVIHLFMAFLMTCAMLLVPHATFSQSKKGGQRARVTRKHTAVRKQTPLISRPNNVSPVDVKERTLAELLYFPLGCLSTDLRTFEEVYTEATNIFGTCERVNLMPGFHHGQTFNYTYRDVPIGVCYYNPIYDEIWYHFYFDTKQEAQQFYTNLCNDLKQAGIPLAPDKIYGGLSNRNRPISIFKWVAAVPPAVAKVIEGSNITLPEAAGKYQVEFSIYKRNTR